MELHHRREGPVEAPEHRDRGLRRARPGRGGQPDGDAAPGDRHGAGAGPGTERADRHPDQQAIAMTTMRERPRKDPRGMTLLELIIGAAIFLVVLLAAYQVFDASHATYSSGQRKVDVQQNARAAMDELMRQIRVAGYFPENFTIPPPATPLVNPIQVAANNALAIYGDVDGSGASNVFLYCLDGTLLRRTRAAQGA